MSETQPKLFVHGLLLVLFDAGACAQSAFEECCRFNGYGIRVDCPETHRIRCAVWEIWGK